MVGGSGSVAAINSYIRRHRRNLEQQRHLDVQQLCLAICLKIEAAQFKSFTVARSQAAQGRFGLKTKAFGYFLAKNEAGVKASCKVRSEIKIDITRYKPEVIDVGG